MERRVGVADASAVRPVAIMQNAPFRALALSRTVPTLETRKLHSPQFHWTGPVLSPGTASGAYNIAQCEIARQRAAST